MSDNNKHEISYEPPTKDFIRKSLLYGLLSEKDADATRSSAQSFTDGYTDLGVILKNKGKIESALIKFAYSNKRRIKKIPWLDELAMNFKRLLLKRAQSGIKPSFSQLDLSGIMGFEVNDFIWQLYILALGRPPDDEGWRKYKYLLCSGATPEAVAYMICTSKEFANRAQVTFFDQYRKAFWHYRLRDGIRRLPLIGWVWAIAAIPNRIYRLEVEERIRHVDSRFLDRQRYESLTSTSHAQQVRVDDLFVEHTTVRRDLDKLLLQSIEFQSLTDTINKEIKAGFEDLSKLKVLETQLIAVNTEIKAGFGILSAQNIETNTQLIELSQLAASFDMNTSYQGEILEALEIANQNIIHANVKLDEAGKLIVDTASRNKQIIYGLSGGVTVVQTKDYIIGVPSQEWRLAVFLSIYGRFEFGSEDYFCSIINAGMNVVDVGANLGIYSLHALKAGCQVYAYEPTPNIYKILLDNIGINGFDPTGRAHVYNLAVSDKEGKAKFAIYDNLSGHNTFYAYNDSDKTVEVNTICLDEHLTILPHVDVVKIDVEGAEPLVLKGMREIIANNPTIKIIMEFAPSHIRRGGRDPIDFIAQIRAMGLDIHMIDEKSGEILDISDEELCAVLSANILLTIS